MIGRIGIIGAGQMGSGIAQVAALAGYPGRLRDASEAARGKGNENEEGKSGMRTLHPRQRDVELTREQRQMYRAERQLTITPPATRVLSGRCT